MSENLVTQWLHSWKKNYMINISFIIIIGKVKYKNLLVYYDHENYVISCK